MQLGVIQVLLELLSSFLLGLFGCQKKKGGIERRKGKNRKSDMLCKTCRSGHFKVGLMVSSQDADGEFLGVQWSIRV